MPYTITTLTPAFGEPSLSVANRTCITVATLFEACEEAAHRIETISGGDPDYEEAYTDAQNCSELGETFGPLPGGVVIEVRRV